MEGKKNGENPSEVSCHGESSDPKIEINVKTLDSRVYTFVVCEKMPVQLFKEEIAIKTGVPVNMQRLIFRGKVLKDDHLLSEYHVEHAHTLHLVERHPVQPQPATPPRRPVEPNGVNNSQGGSNVGGPQGRVGQISHSVVLGTFNIGDQSAAMGPDISRVIGAVFNSLGISPQAAAGVSGEHTTMQANLSGQTPVMNLGDQVQGGSGGPNQSQSGNQTNGYQGIPQPLFQPIHDSLNTIYQFMNLLEMGFSMTRIGEDGSQTAPQPVSEALPNVTLPLNERGVPTPEALLLVLERVMRLFNGPTVSSLYRVAGVLEREGIETDTANRNQGQMLAVQVGFLIQQLGALLLELGRAMMALRMGESPEQSSVNIGPAIYITPTRPVPIMVQASSFGTPASPFNEEAFGYGGSVSSVPRHVNIHIHTGVVSPHAVGRAEGEDTSQGEPAPAASGPASSVRNMIAATLPIPVPVPTIGLVIPAGVQSGFPVPPNFTTGVVPAPLNSQGVPARHPQNIIDEQPSVGNTTGGSMDLISSVPSSEEQPRTVADNQNSGHNASSSQDRPSVPLGLGTEGLRPKRLNKHPRIDNKSDVSGTSEEVKLARGGGVRDDGVQNSNPASENGLSFLQNMGGALFRGQGQQGNFDIGNVLSQVVESPALDGLFTGISQQAGVVSQDALRNIMGQVTQNPTVRNALGHIVNQIAHQDDVGNPAPVAGGAGGAIDFSQIVQQIMPIVSQVLGGGGGGPPRTVPEASPEENQASNGQVDMEVEEDLPEGIFRKVVEKAAGLSENGTFPLDFVDDLCSDGSLVDEYKDLVKRQVGGGGRTQPKGGGSDEKL